METHIENILDDLWKARNPKDALFLELIKGYKIKKSMDFPNSLFYIKDDAVLIDYDKKTKYCWINYELIWEVFKSKFSLNSDEIRELMGGMLETHLKLKGTTPTTLFKQYAFIEDTSQIGGNNIRINCSVKFLNI